MISIILYFSQLTPKKKCLSPLTIPEEALLVHFLFSLPEAATKVQSVDPDERDQEELHRS